MNRAQLAMAYQACEVADLATAAVTLDDPAQALAAASQVLVAARELVAAAHRLSDGSTPSDPLQVFAYEHPEEAAADISDWLRRCRSPEDQAGAHARADG